MKLRTTVQAFDDDALASLANKGLLRRAQKDVQTQKPAIIDVDDVRVRLQAADGTVVVPELPSRSKCNCPATGTCRHVLMSLLYLRDDPELAAATAPQQATLFADDSGAPADSASTAAPSPDPAGLDPARVLAALGDEELLRWAGKSLFNKAQKSLAVHPQVEIESAAALVIRFPTRNITCRWIPSGGLLSMICSCQAENVCEHVVAAVLAYQVSLGKRTIAHEAALPTESSGAPRTRAEILQSVAAVVQELAALGLARVSAAAKQRVTTLAVSAHGVDLPRLERMLKTTADEIDLVLRRDARASTTTLLRQAARLGALCTALERKPAAGLIGVHRTQYLDVGQITLHGFGAHRWRSKGGYHGVTVVFWDESHGAWSTWTESRPVGQTGFDPLGRFRADGPWLGVSSPREAAQSVLRLTGAWRNPQGRISGRPSTRAIVVGPSDMNVKVEVIMEWPALADRVRKLFGGGLAEAAEHSELVLLKPAAWGPAFYDPVRQQLLRPLADTAGRGLELWLPFNAENEEAIDRLERHDPRETLGVLGALRWIDGGVRVQPISLVEPEGILSLNLPEAKQNKPNVSLKTAAANRSSAEEDDPETLGADDEDDEFRSTAASNATTELGRLLATAESELEAAAESGVAVRRDPELLAAVTRKFTQLGFEACARALTKYLDAAAVVARSVDGEARTAAASALLRAYYVVRLAREQEAVASACAGLTG